MKTLALFVLGTLLFGLSSIINVLIDDSWLSITAGCFGGALIGWGVATISNFPKGNKAE